MKKETTWFGIYTKDSPNPYCGWSLDQKEENTLPKSLKFIEPGIYAENFETINEHMLFRGDVVPSWILNKCIDYVEEWIRLYE